MKVNIWFLACKAMLNVLVGWSGIEKTQKHLFVRGIPANRDSIQYCSKRKTTPGIYNLFQHHRSRNVLRQVLQKHHLALYASFSNLHFKCFHPLLQFCLPGPYGFNIFQQTLSLSIHFLCFYLNHKILSLVLLCCKTSFTV